MKTKGTTAAHRVFAIADGYTFEVKYLKVFVGGEMAGQTADSYTWHVSRIEAETASKVEHPIYTDGSGQRYTWEALTFGPIGGNATVQTPTKKRVDTAIATIKAQFNNAEYMAAFMQRVKETERGIEQVLKSAEVDWEKIYRPRNYRTANK